MIGKAAALLLAAVMLAGAGADRAAAAPALRFTTREPHGPTVRGLATWYNAANHHCVGRKCYDTPIGAWWSTTAPKSAQWVSASPKGCKRHPAWECYKRDMGGWRKLVRPYAAKLRLYAAAGPALKKAIAKVYGGWPSIWHRVPFIRVRFSVLLPNGITLSQVAYVVDTCICQGVRANPNDTRIVDMSPALWSIFTTARVRWGIRKVTAEVLLP